MDNSKVIYVMFKERKQSPSVNQPVLFIVIFVQVLLYAVIHKLAGNLYGILSSHFQSNPRAGHLHKSQLTYPEARNCFPCEAVMISQ